MKRQTPEVGTVFEVPLESFSETNSGSVPSPRNANPSYFRIAYDNGWSVLGPDVFGGMVIFVSSVPTEPITKVAITTVSETSARGLILKDISTESNDA